MHDPDVHQRAGIPRPAGDLAGQAAGQVDYDLPIDGHLHRGADLPPFREVTFELLGYLGKGRFTESLNRHSVASQKTSLLR